MLDFLRRGNPERYVSASAQRNVRCYRSWALLWIRARGACILVCYWLVPAAAAFADAEPDWLPDAAAVTVKPQDGAPAAKLFLDVAADWNRQDNSSATPWHGNIGIDGYAAAALGADWRGVLSGRLDLDSAPGAGLSRRNLSLTLREAYVSAEAGGWVLDAGRINIRDGVATGYSPTDVFRNGALLVRRTEDPNRLRDSRLGVVGLRLQRYTPAGEFAGLLSPRIAGADDPSWYDPRWGAVNDGRAQLYFKYTPPRWHGIYSNVVWHRAEGGAGTWGLNATDNIGQSLVGYVEYARARQASLPALAGDAAAPRHVFSQFSTGLSFSTETRQTLTVEYERNGGGVGDRDRQGSWQSAESSRLASVFAEAGQRQDPLGRDSLMLLLQWDRFLARDAELTCLGRLNMTDKSRFGWCEWRYKQPKAEWSLSVSRRSGDDRSEFGAAQQPWVVGAKARIYY